jgi:hypothetical protein
MPVYTCSKCGFARESNSNLHRHVRSKQCLGATIVVTGRKRAFNGYREWRTATHQKRNEEPSAQETQTQDNYEDGSEDDARRRKARELVDAVKDIADFTQLPAAIFDALKPSYDSKKHTADAFAKSYMRLSVQLLTDALKVCDCESLRNMLHDTWYTIADRQYTVCDGVALYGTKAFSSDIPKNLRKMIVECKNVLRERAK